MERSFFEGWTDFRGTRGRLNYFLTALLIGLFLIVSGTIAGLFIGTPMMMFSTADPVVGPEVNGFLLIIALIILVAIVIFSILATLSLTYQRLRSIGVESAGALLGLTVLFTVGAIFFLHVMLMFIPSKEQMSGEVTAKTSTPKAKKEPMLDKDEVLGLVVIVGVPLIAILLLIQIFN